MNTPVADFVRAYAGSGVSRLHMPGHKGQPFLGCEALDITEVQGADALFEAAGILRESEEHAASLFGAARTLYSTEGSSLCIRAMLCLALTCRPAGTDRLILAARNVHRSFVYAAALLDLPVRWLWPQAGGSLCSCPVTGEELDQALSSLPRPPAAVYVTSPDYLGLMQPIEELAQVCHRHGTLLLVDNAHGAYLHFLPKPCHPMDLGADLCCDSAHKTLPVLTGGAYLHISRQAPPAMASRAKQAMAMFGSTSPSYLTLASLDLCNGYLAGSYRERLHQAQDQLQAFRLRLQGLGWHVPETDPLRLTLHTARSGLSGKEIAGLLRQHQVECECSSRDEVVLMVTPENHSRDLERVIQALGKAPDGPALPAPPVLPGASCIQAMTPREALFSPQETIPTFQALGRICGAPTVACPPSIPVVISGERFGPEALAVLAHYDVEAVDVVANP